MPLRAGSVRMTVKMKSYPPNILYPRREKMENDDVRPYDFIFPTVVGEIEMPMVELSRETEKKLDREWKELKDRADQLEIPDTGVLEEGFTNIEYNGAVYKCPYDDEDEDRPCPVWSPSLDGLKEHIVMDHMGRDYAIVAYNVNQDGTIDDDEYIFGVLDVESVVKPKDMIGGDRDFP